MFAVATRFWALGDKPFHHDESLFASHAYHLSRTADYDYDPVLHGPFLIDATALIFRLAGDGDATARLCPAVCGVLLLLVVWGLRSRLGNLAAFFAVALLAASPTLMYYSRFTRNDVPFALAAMTCVFCAVRFLERGRPHFWLLTILAAIWMICIKETYVVFFFAAATCGAGLWLVERAAGRPSSFRATLTGWKTCATVREPFGRAFAMTTVLGLGAGAFVAVVLFTTFFRHPEHAIGPIEALRYWSGQHAEQRIFGEWHYYIPILFIYEFLALAVVVWGVARTLRRATWLRGAIAWAWLAWSIVLLGVLWPYRFPRELENLLHMQRGWHLWLAVQIFALGAAACAVLATDQRRLDAFFLWWTVVSFLAYSYAGEKVPWLSVHIVVPMILTAAAFLQEAVSRQWERAGHGASRQPESHENAGVASDRSDRSDLSDQSDRSDRADLMLESGSIHTVLLHCTRAGPSAWLALTALAIGFIATAGVALRLCFVNEANVAERHVYTHTTRDYKAAIADLNDIAARLHMQPLERVTVFVGGHSIWPGLWYFRHWRLRRPKDPSTGVDPNDRSILPPEDALRALDFVILDEYLDPAHTQEHALSRYPGLPRTHVIRRVPFREWWRQEDLITTFARLFDIWMALVPKQYRIAPLTDKTGAPVGWIGDRAGLPDMKIADEIEAGRRAWRAIYDYLVYRRDFDPYHSPLPTRDHMAVLVCVRKDVYKKWTQQGGRHHPSRTRVVRSE